MRTSKATTGVIDSASVYELVGLFGLSTPEEATPWMWTSAVEVTCAIIETDHLLMAPAPTTTGGASGPYGLLTRRLAGRVLHPDLDQCASAKAQALVKSRCSRSPDRVRDAFQSVKDDKRNFQGKRILSAGGSRT